MSAPRWCPTGGATAPAVSTARGGSAATSAAPSTGWAGSSSSGRSTTPPSGAPPAPGRRAGGGRGGPRRPHPRGRPLSPALCDASFAAARPFMARHHPGGRYAFAACHSWLLDRALADGLAPAPTSSPSSGGSPRTATGPPPTTTWWTPLP
ncbi:hypothetical protein ACFQ60_05165 [Streptomyces zhihengii]